MVVANVEIAHGNHLLVANAHEGKVRRSQHNAVPFGEMASVHAWESGGLVLRIACTILHLPVLRYMDDFLVNPNLCSLA